VDWVAPYGRRRSRSPCWLAEAGSAPWHACMATAEDFRTVEVGPQTRAQHAEEVSQPTSCDRSNMAVLPTGWQRVGPWPNGAARCNAAFLSSCASAVARGLQKHGTGCVHEPASVARRGSRLHTLNCCSHRALS